tara:strand:+ start:3940 stop:4125 length:186 start_codon:yes stop_codon:yes gene_type:complete
MLEIILNLLFGEIANSFRNSELICRLNKSLYIIVNIDSDPKLKIMPGKSHDSIGTPFGEYV